MDQLLHDGTAIRGMTEAPRPKSSSCLSDRRAKVNPRGKRLTMTSLMLLVEHEIRPKSEEGASAKMPVEDPIIFKSGIFIGWIFPAFAKVTFWNIGANFIYQLRFRSP
jgi:hypothetical protein